MRPPMWKTHTHTHKFWYTISWGCVCGYQSCKSQFWHISITPESCHITICPLSALESFPSGKTHKNTETNTKTHTHSHRLMLCIRKDMHCKTHMYPAILREPYKKSQTCQSEQRYFHGLSVFNDNTHLSASECIQPPLFAVYLCCQSSSSSSSLSSSLPPNSLSFALKFLYGF